MTPLLCLHLSKNYKMVMNKIQMEDFKPPWIWNILMTLRLLNPWYNYGDFHIFLSLINNSRNNVWFQTMININGNALCLQMKQMTKAIKLKHNYTNKFVWVITISPMSNKLNSSNVLLFVLEIFKSPCYFCISCMEVPIFSYSFFFTLVFIDNSYVILKI